MFDSITSVIYIMQEKIVVVFWQEKIFSYKLSLRNEISPMLWSVELFPAGEFVIYIYDIYMQQRSKVPYLVSQK